MANLIEGKLVKILPEQRGESARGHWARGGFVIEYGDEYPRKVAFSVFGEEKIEGLKRIPVNTRVSVQFSPESREYNERWYTDLKAISIAAPTASVASQQHSQCAPAPQQPAQTQLGASSDDNDDLPF